MVVGDVEREGVGAHHIYILKDDIVGTGVCTPGVSPWEKKKEVCGFDLQFFVGMVG